MAESLTISDLSYLEDVSADLLRGGYADANTYTYTASGTAVAHATAIAEGQITSTNAQANTVAKETVYLNFSQAFAVGFAVSISTNKIDADISASQSTNLTLNRQ